MSSIDLRRYITSRPDLLTDRAGSAALSAHLLRLSRFGQQVTLNGPLSVRVTVLALNQFTLAGKQSEDQLRPLYSYRLDIPAGREWTYSYPRTADSAVLMLGANSTFEVHIEPAGGATDYYDALGVDPFRAAAGCGCHATPRSCHTVSRGDIPCDFAVGDNRNVGQFFPSACEPCAPNAYIRMPPLQGPRLNIAPAAGGCTRTNYFNGMFITKEDLQTDQRNMRIKQQLQNRAMGQGVVWGLGLFLDGSSVGVLPGYGVDCCGNDITVTSSYRVEQQLLVQDPAAAAELAKVGPQRMHLLLEYFECPEDPRPVHGDLCSPETTHCEMGRIRETARLRLVPPRDLDTRGPIAEFIKAFMARSANAANDVNAAPASPTFVNPTGNTPFSLSAALTEGLTVDGVNPPSKLTLQPVFDQTITTAPVNGLMFAVNGVPSVSFHLEMAIPQGSGNQFPAAPAVSFKDSSLPGFAVPNIAVTMPDSRTAAFDLRIPGELFIQSLDRTPKGFVTLTVKGWEVSKPGNLPPATTGNTDLTMAWDRSPGRPSVTVSAATFGGRSSVPPAPRFRCFTEGCDPAAGPLFPVTPPWMHNDPRGSGRAFDPTILGLAAFYAQFLAKDVTGELSARLGSSEVLPWIRKLYQDWCQSGLYRGPRCAGEPHGVVIGCAVVEGGRIVSVDPWGGRRWVLHFPLLTHWTGLAGVAPLDYLASKLFEFICCIGSYLGDGPRDADQKAGPVDAAAGIPLGTSVLFLQTREQIQSRFANQKLADRELSLTEFVSRAALAVSRPSTQPLGNEADLLSTATLPNLFLMVPTESAVRPQTAVARTQPMAADPLRLSGLLRGVIVSTPTGKGVPALLQSFTTTLSTRLLRAIPLTSLGVDDPELLQPLATAGFRDVAAILSADPDRLHTEVLKSARAVPLARLLDSSDQFARQLTASVCQVVFESSRTGLTVREDLLDAGRFDSFANALALQLGKSLRTKFLTDVVVRQAAADAVGTGK